MRSLERLRRLLGTPGMPPAFLRWCVGKAILGRPPHRTLPSKARIGEWRSFSEYWSFRQGIPLREALFIQRCLGASPHEAIALDVGANVGLFTCEMLAQGAQVHAFEPVADTFVRLRRNVAANGATKNARLNCLAVGSSQSFITLRIDDAAPATNQMASIEAGPILDDAPGAWDQMVATINLDHYCTLQQLTTISFVKIDVEGMEPHVLRGASALLKSRSINAILIEVCPHNLKTVGSSVQELYAEFEYHGYLPYFLSESGVPDAPASLAELAAIPLSNVVLAPPP